MKKTTIVLFAVVLLAACQKEYAGLSANANNQSKEIVSQDTVYFDTIHVIPHLGLASDYGFGKTVCFFDPFYITNDTMYIKHVNFILHKSDGAHLTKAELLLDGGRSVNGVDITNYKSGDNIKFNFVTPRIIIPQRYGTNEHLLALRIIGSGAEKEWYQVKLVHVDIIRNNNPVVIINLPEFDYKYGYDHSLDK